MILNSLRVFRRIRRGFLMIDKEPRQHEQPRHPEYHENDVAGLEPEIGHRQYLIHSARYSGSARPFPAANYRKQMFDMGNRRVLADAMAQIEHMRPVSKGIEHPQRLLFQLIAARQQ